MDSTNDIVCALKKRYAGYPPLLLSRSVERAKDETELFDILDVVPKEFPLIWSNDERRWVTCDLIQLPAMRGTK